MPPRKRKAPAAAASTNTTTTSRRSKLAKENNLTAEQEREIKEVWALCALEDVEDFQDQKEGVIKTSDVDAVMRALGIAPRTSSELNEFVSILDPEEDGYVTYPHFVELCAIQINSKTEEAKDEEVEKAFKLFTKGVERSITLHDLRQVAHLLRENIGDDVLKAMILEANGGASIGHGVNQEQFKNIMTRAGIS